MNSIFLKTAPLLLAAGCIFGGASAAHAQVTLSYTVSNFSFTVPGGEASFKTGSPSTQSVTLTPGVADVVNFQSVFFTVDPTDNAGDFSGPASRTLTVDGIAHSITQNFDLTTDYGDGVNTADATDTLLFYPGSAVSYNLGSQGTLTFTPETLDPGGSFNAVDSGTYFNNLKGRFLLTPAAAVPEASTTVSLGLLLGGLALLGIRARKRSAAQAQAQA